MLADALVEELRSRGEGPDLDYRAKRYACAKATAEQKSELTPAEFRQYHKPETSNLAWH